MNSSRRELLRRLVDIKNEVQSSKLRSKRPINEDCSVGASLMDIENGRMVPINQDSEFIIGRDLTSSIIIEESFISRRHCSIRYENNHYFISDLQSRSGTFLNCKRLSSSKTNIKQLHHGDLIGFGDERNITITYKFILPNISNKKPRLYNEHDLEDHTEDETCKMNIKTIQKEILNIKADHIVLRNNAKTKLDEIQNMMSNIVEITSIENEKQNDAIQKMTNEISTLMVKLKEALNDVNSPNSFKKQIYSQLETELQCTICNELMYKAMVLNCNHTFCEICIETWKSSNPACPICRTHITYYSNCLTLDNYITNICDLIGGEVNDQRQSLQRERLLLRPPTEKKRNRCERIRRYPTVQRIYHL